MAKCKLLMQTGQVQKIIDFFDGYSDDKGVFKGTPEGKVLYFSIQPDGFFG